LTVTTKDGNDDDTGTYLSWLDYHIRDEENGGNRTIRINSNPKLVITLKRNRRYSRNAIENLVCGYCNNHELDYVGLDTVTNCVKEIIWNVNNESEEEEDVNNNNNKNKKYNSIPILSVSDAIRIHSGKVKTLGRIVGVSPPYKVVTTITWDCPRCGYESVEDLDPPLPFFNPSRKKCPTCSYNNGNNNNGNSNGDGRRKNQKQIDLIDLIALPEYENAKSISFQDSEPGDDLEKLHVVLLEDNGRNVRVGERAIIIGNMYILGAGGGGAINSSSNGSKNSSAKLFPVLYADAIRYEREEEKPITEKEIEGFKRFAQMPNLVDRLVSMFAPNVIGHSDAKLGILRSAVNTKNNIRIRSSNSTADIRNRTHSLLAGDPGTAKSMLAKEATKIVPNSRYVTAQHASIKSVMAIIDKEQDNSKMLFLGAVPMSKNAICVINEIGSMPYEDQQHLADVLEEGRFTIDKHGIYQEIDSPTTIIATANPHGGCWDKTIGPDIDQIPIKSNILDRFDQVYIFKGFQTDEERRDYVMKKMEMNQSSITYNYDFLKRYLQYAASIKEPSLTPEASNMLSEFWMRLSNEGHAANRTLDSLVRIAKAQARLHLEEEIDIEIANEVTQSVGLMLAEFGRAVDTAVADPRDLAYNEVIEYVNRLEFPITFTESVRYVCAHNNALKQYFGDRLSSISDNKRLRSLHDRFTDRTQTNKYSRSGLAVAIVGMSPLTLVKAAGKEQNDEREQKSDGSNRSSRSNTSYKKEEESNNKNHSSVIDSLDRIDRSQTDDRDQKRLLGALQKAMLDGQGKSKGYFSLLDLDFHLQMLPNNAGWNEDKTKELIDQLLQEGRLHEIERGKYKPATT
jgi:DNA replicative helicase MCM subunit Mcm2 (Cdc46/Mcm family)